MEEERDETKRRRRGDERGGEARKQAARKTNGKRGRKMEDGRWRESFLLWMDKNPSTRKEETKKAQQAL